MVKSESDIIDTIHTGQVITDENGTQYFVCGKTVSNLRTFRRWRSSDWRSDCGCRPAHGGKGRFFVTHR